MIIQRITLPSHWACALINGDDSGLSDADCAALEHAVAAIVADYGQAHLSLRDDAEASFTLAARMDYGSGSDGAADCYEYELAV